MAAPPSTRPLVALSPDGSTLACIPTSAGGEASTSILRVLLFQVESGTLQSTLTHRNKPGETTSPLSNPLKVFFVSSEVLVVLFSDKLFSWDLNRGVIAHRIHTKSPTQSFHDACGAQETVFVLVAASDTSKVQVLKYSTTTGKLERVIKAGKGGGASGLGMADENLIVRSEDMVRIMRLSDGKKICKCSSLEETNAGDQNLFICQNMIATISQGQIVLINVKSGKKLSSVPLDKATTTSARTSFDLWKQNNTNLILAEGEKLHQIDVHSGKVQKTWNCPMDGSLERQYRVGHSNSVIALLYKNGQYQVVSESLSETGNDVVLSWKSPEDTKTEDSDSKQTQKRKKAQAGAGSQSTILGPGETGGEALISEGPVSKKSKMEQDLEDDDDDDQDAGEENPTVGERLQLLQQALDEEEDSDNDNEGGEDAETALEHGIPGFAPKQATTESLGKVLEQGLQSGEDKLVELALAVRDRTTLTETCEALSDDLLPGLMNALTTRMAAKGGRAAHLCIWVSVLLKSGRIKSIAHLQPLRNLIQERIEVFPDLLQLEGRLSLMTQAD